MYNKFRSNIIRNGDLLAWRNDGSVLGNAISYWTKGIYTHVGIVWTLHNRAYVLDAYFKGGVRLRYLGDNLPVDVIHTKIKWTKDLEDGALSKLGRSYNYLGAAMLGFDITPNYDSEVCSLYAASILNKGGMNIPKDKSITLTPQKLVDKVCELSNSEIKTIKNLKGLQYE
jgi:hypothetical protein